MQETSDKGKQNEEKHSPQAGSKPSTQLASKNSKRNRAVLDQSQPTTDEDQQILYDLWELPPSWTEESNRQLNKVKN